MHDQAAQLRDLVRASLCADPALRPGPPTIIVTGAERRVGSSTIAFRTAQELARLGKRVMIIDADPIHPRQSEIAGVEPNDGVDAVLSGARCIVEQVTRVSQHVELLASRSAAKGRLQRDGMARLISEIAGLGDRTDLVVVDAGTGMTPWAERLWRHAQQALLVCTAQSHSVKQAYTAVKLAHSPALRGKIRLTINRCDDEAKAANVASRFAETCQRFLSLSVNQFAWLPTDRTDAGRYHGDSEPDQRYQRCLRLLAADAAAEVRATAMRLISREPAAPRAAEAMPENAQQADNGVRAKRESNSPPPSDLETHENGPLVRTQLKSAAAE